MTMVGNDGGMINRLQDDLLRHIISFLPTRDAVQTSVLSTKWKDLWTSISNIELDDAIHISLDDDIPPVYRKWKSSILDVIDRILLLHDHSDIERFLVGCSDPVDEARLCSWIYDVMKHNLKELKLSFSLPKTFVLPLCVFSSECLTALTICMNCTFEFPPLFTVHFPSLKSLRLSHVQFVNEESTQQLFSNCPVLQILSLTRCKWENVNCLVIRIPTLESVSIWTCEADLDDLLRFLHFTLVCPRLTSFHCEIDANVDIDLSYPSSLVNGSLYFFNIMLDHQVVNQRLIRLLSCMQNSARLSVSSETLESLSLGGHLPEHVHVLQKLARLDVVCMVNGSTMVAVMKFLQNTPNLEFLSLSSGFNDKRDDEWTVDAIPSCLINKLKKFTISNFSMYGDEMQLVKLFMESCNSLEMVEIKTVPLNNPAKLHKAEKQLEAFPRLSNKCALVLKPCYW